MKHKKRASTNPLVPNKAEYCYAGGKKKRRYTNRLDAELFAPSRALEQYVCEYCGFWHNGTPSLKVKRK